MARTTHEPNSVWFDNLYTLLDAVLLVGGWLEPTDRDACKLRILVARARSQWPLLYWTITILHRHGISMRLNSGAATIGDKLAFVSPPSRFYKPAFDRWYPSWPTDRCRRAVTPDDLRLDEPTLAVWLVAGLARPRKFFRGRGALSGMEEVRLAAPRLTQSLAQRLSVQVAKLSGWRVEPVPTARYWALRLDERDRPAAEAYLAMRGVPPAVWRGLEQGGF